MTSIGNSPAWSQQPITVSGILITFNQHLFIRSALESVLAQTYPLDLVIADDASEDGTFAVMESILKNYSGHHRIRLLRASRNRGICRNQNAALQLTEGELVVLFEGDDVSTAERVDRLVTAYRERGGEVGALGSAVRKMDRHGAISETLTWPVSRGDAAQLLQGKWPVAGCGLAIRRDCFSDIGPITHRLISGDIALWMRAAFLRAGGMAFIPDALVDYRIHGDNTSSRISLRFSSRAALRECCRSLLKNEVAQVVELKKIGRYRRRLSLRDPAVDPVLSSALTVAKARAALVLAIARTSCGKWILPAAAALRHRALRTLAIRTLALALCPFAYKLRLAKGSL
jgi:glycosyltransferase involved in cell wall biosynthesis